MCGAECPIGGTKRNREASVRELIEDKYLDLDNLEICGKGNGKYLAYSACFISCFIGGLD